MSDWVVESEVKTRLGHKVLLAGLSEAGKTAVKQLYFNNSKIEEISGLQATLNYERLATTINGVPITILDLGGQRVFIKRFLSGFSPFVFSSVKGLIYLIDVSAKSTRNNSLQYFLECIKKLKQFSPKAQIFVYLHKTDLIKKSPNYNTVLQLIMEQFQVETDIKIKFFHTTIYDEKTVISSFLRIFDLILPTGVENKAVEKVEHYATVKFTSKNVDFIDTPTTTKVDPTSTIFEKSERGVEPTNQVKIAGDLNVLQDIQQLMQQSAKEEVEIDEFPIAGNKPFEILSNLQLLIKEGMVERLKENKKEELFLLSLMNSTENVLANPDDVDPEKKQYLAKKVLTELMKEHVTIQEPDLEETSETSIVEKGEEVTTLYTNIDLDKKIQRLMSFYNIKKEDAESIIRFDYEDVLYELVAKSNLPIRMVLNVLLVNIPFLELSEYDTSVLSNDKILDVFKYLLIGQIKDRDIFSALEKIVQNPEKSLEELIG